VIGSQPVPSWTLPSYPANVRSAFVCFIAGVLLSIGAKLRSGLISCVGDFQGRCHSLAATQAAWIKGSAWIDSGSSGGLLSHTSSG
jgi:hypothetical protein